MIPDSRLLKNRWARALSMLLAAPLALVLLLHPTLMLNADGTYSHSMLMLMMLGISSGFIHGVGFDPIGLAWRILFHPVLGWVLMLMGYAVMARTLLA